MCVCVYVYKYLYMKYTINKLDYGSKEPHVGNDSKPDKSTARIKIVSSLLSSWQILRTLRAAFFSRSLIYEDQWSISPASNKGLLKDVL